MRPSFLVSFFPVLMNTKNNNEATTVKILAIRNGDKSAISKGEIIAIIPSTNVAQTITEPIKSPRIIQFSPRRAEIIEKYISGKQFPRPKIKMPTSPREIPS